MAIVIKTAGFEDLLNSGDYYLKALIIGENGVGKTPFAAQWPKPLFALCENGHMSLAQSGTAYADIKSSADMEAVLRHARVESMKPIASRSVQTLVIDTVDSYQKILIQERLKETGQQGLSGWADWGWLEGKMGSLTEAIKRLPMNVVVLMHTRDVHEQVGDKDDEVTRIVQRARMKGDVKDSIYDNFPLIGLIESTYAAEKGKRSLARTARWQPDPKHPILRDQSTRLPATTKVSFTQDDYQQIFDAISGGLDSLPASAVVGEIETPAQAPVPDSVDEVGALKSPTLPPAKKAAAKKTAAKKTAAAPAKAEVTEVAEPAEVVPPSTDVEPAEEPKAPKEDPWEPPAVAEPEAAAAAHLVEDVTMVEAARQAKAKADAKAAAKAPVDVTHSVVLPDEPEATAPKPPGTKVCGSQPVTFAGKHEAFPGCGNDIPPGTTSASVSIVRHKTFLCPACFESASK